MGPEQAERMVERLQASFARQGLMRLLGTRLVHLSSGVVRQQTLVRVISDPTS